MLWQVLQDSLSSVGTIAAAAAVVAAIWLLHQARDAVRQIVGMSFRGTAYLQQQQRLQGDAFRIGGIGPRLVFISDPVAIRTFFTAATSDLEFQKAVEHFTQRVFLLDSSGFFPRLQRMWRSLRNMLTGSALLCRASELASRLDKLLDRKLPEGIEVDLMAAVKELLFEAVARQLFGDLFVDKHGAARLGAALAVFEDNFETAASPVPQFLQRKFCSARQQLLSAFRSSLKEDHLKGTLLGGMLAECDIDADEAPNVLLAVMWAAMANSVPAAFWTLALVSLPAHRQLADSIRTECSRRSSGSPSTGPDARSDAAVMAALDPQSLVRRCANETVRLFSPSIDVRIAARSLVLPAAHSGCAARPVAAADRQHHGSTRGFSVQKGDIIAVSPFLAHRDSRLYPDDPCAFDPDRSATRPSVTLTDRQTAERSTCSASPPHICPAVSLEKPAKSSINGTLELPVCQPAPVYRNQPHDAIAEAAVSNDTAPGWSDGKSIANASAIQDSFPTKLGLEGIAGVSQAGIGFGGGVYRCLEKIKTSRMP